jgi:protein TonB
VNPTLKEGNAPIRDRLTTTLFLAGLFHGIVLLGVTFSAGLADPDDMPTLEVLLVSSDLPESQDNPDADYLAQRSQLGSGNTYSGQVASPQSALVPIDNPGIPQGQALTSQAAGQERGATELLSSTASTTPTPRFADTTEEMDGTEQTALLMRAGPVSPLPSNDDAAEVVLRGERVRELLVTPNTRESEVAIYLDSWKRKVERIGTLNFPAQVRQPGLSGSPVLEVAIRSNGVLEDILIRRSSGHKELDQAALAILKLSTPFDPFPQDLATRHDVLRFAYEWQFLGGALVDSAVRAGAPAGP